MILTCPHCGARPAVEFAFVIAEEAVAWPQTMGMLTRRTNPRGASAEIWRHAAGCRGFVRITRDTFSHAIVETRALP